MSEKRNCSVCGAENSNEYEYCLECGSKLPILVREPVNDATAAPVLTNSQAYNGEVGAESHTENAEHMGRKVSVYCSKCGYGAEEGDRFCNKCGASLHSFAQQPQQSGYNQQPQAVPSGGQAYYNIYGGADLGVDENDLREFIGPNDEVYVNKFKRMKFGGGKASWNWPVFLFSFFLNIPFVWFFYRKMYKVGSVLLAVSIALSILSSVFSVGYITPFIKYSGELISEAENNLPHYYEYDDYESDEQLYKENEQYFNEYYNDILNNTYEFVDEAMPYFTALFLLSLGNLALTIVISILANNMYFNHCVKKIKAVTVQDNEQRRFYLCNTGGTSCGAAVALGILVPIVSGIISIIMIVSACMVIL